VILISELYDLNINVKSEDELDSFIEMAKRLGFHGFAVQGVISNPIQRRDDGFVLLQRYDLHRKNKMAMRNQIKKIRYNVVLVSSPLLDISLANWAAEENRIDLLTLVEPYTEYKLRKTTAKLAASADTALEIPIRPLLVTNGMARARILKAFRESVATASSAGMPIVLSSHADIPLAMRSPRAMQYIGYLLGMDMLDAKRSVRDIPSSIISKNKEKLDRKYIVEGIEILEGEKET